MTFAWSRWAGAAPSLRELPAPCQPDSRVPVTRQPWAASLGHLDVVAFSERLGTAPVSPGAVLALAPLPGVPGALGRAELAPSAVWAVRAQGAGLQGRMTAASGTGRWLSPRTGQKAARGRSPAVTGWWHLWG